MSSCIVELISTIVQQFQLGARSFRSEVVANMKKDALAIFEITDIPAGSFLDPQARAASKQLAALRQNNAFLSATEEAIPGPDDLYRYLRSQCLVRVSDFFSWRVVW